MVDRLKRWGASVDAWLQQRRSTRVLRRAAIGFVQHGSLQYAGSMAYFSILSVFQLLVLGIVVLSYFVGQGQARQFVIDQVRAGSPLNADTIGSVLDAVIASRAGISLFGLIFLIWGALGIFSAITQGVGRAFGATMPRPFWQDKLIGLVLMLITGVLGIASVAIGILTGILQSATQDVLAAVPGGYLALSLIGFVTPIVLIFVAFLVLYRLVPNRHVTWREALPGAIAATILWTVLRIGFTYYTTNIARYDTAFGPISATISLLVFLYFASVIVLLGAEVARANVLEDTEPVAQEVVPIGPIVGRTLQARPDPGPPEARVPAWVLAISAAAAAFVVRIIAGRRAPHD
ncbi:MAG TPA: YihY/virulence factor BrkB family protein [Candidatus Limnocylindria bacterium]|jgi:membrane protein|nr:YihY/virulence factor BrkB family protein [Candidatus Limnocylindria bacterium]